MSEECSTRQRRPGDVAHERGTTCSEEWTEQKPLSTWASCLRQDKSTGHGDLSATWTNRCRSLGASNRGWRCSTVMPDGPPAAPRLADLRLRANCVASNLNVDCGLWCTSSSGTGLNGTDGLFCGSLNDSNEVVEGSNPTFRPRSHPIGKINRTPESRRWHPGDRRRHHQQVGGPHDGSCASGHFTIPVRDVDEEWV